MKQFLVQLTPEGGVDGSKIVPADSVGISQSGALVFTVSERAVAFFPTFIACAELGEYAAIETATNAFNAQNGDAAPSVES